MTVTERLECWAIGVAAITGRHAVRHLRRCPLTLLCPWCVACNVYVRWLRRRAPALLRWLDARRHD